MFHEIDKYNNFWICDNDLRNLDLYRNLRIKSCWTSLTMLATFSAYHGLGHICCTDCLEWVDGMTMNHSVVLCANNFCQK